MKDELPKITIREIRARYRLTQREFGKSVGVSFQSVSKWEEDINTISVPNLIKICKTYNVKSIDLLGY